ncbi:MAG: hypothetical protein ACXVI4_08065 [Halobacteriota archaeon]
MTSEDGILSLSDDRELLIYQYMSNFSIHKPFTFILALPLTFMLAVVRSLWK